MYGIISGTIIGILGGILRVCATAGIEVIKSYSWEQGRLRKLVFAVQAAKPCIPYWKGQGDFISRLIMEMSGVIIWVIGVISLRAKPT